MALDLEQIGRRSSRDGGFVVLLAMVVAASRTPGGWSDPPKGFTAQGIREAMSRTRRDLADYLPPGFRLLQVQQGRVRLNPAIRASEGSAALGGPHPRRGGG